MHSKYLRVVALFTCIVATQQIPLFAHAGTFNEDAVNRLQDSELLQVSSAWNGRSIRENSTTTLPIHSEGTFSWGVQLEATDTKTTSYLATLSNATYTVGLYKGTLGDSQLLYSQTVPEGTATSSGSFPFTLPGSGSYFLTYTATYPDGTYPTNYFTTCHSDFCLLPQYVLSDFETFMTTGQAEPTSDYGHLYPALFGMEQFTIAADGPKASSVLFLPGTMESRLYMKGIGGIEQMLWEPIYNADISALAMNPDGSSVNSIYTRDVIDYLYSNNVALKVLAATTLKETSVLYGPFELFLNSLVQNHTIAEWRSFPYDWRYDVEEIVHSGTLVASATSSPTRVYLQDVIAELASSSPTGKVTIVAHSNGGLLAKALAQNLEASGKGALLDSIILVGTPQLGTPSAIGNLLHGDGQSRALGLISQGTTVRAVGKELSGPYDLLPSPSYFSYVHTPVSTFDSSASSSLYKTSYGSPIHTYDSFSSFVLDTATLHPSPNASDLKTPIALSPELLTTAANTHAHIDSWLPASDVELTSISGIGAPTISGYAYSTKAQALSHQPILTNQGDDTVVSISAAANPGRQLYFDTHAYAHDTQKHIVHQSLLTAVPVQKQIQNILMKTPDVEYYLSSTTPTYGIAPELVVSAHSPVNLLVTDSDGNQTGTISLPGTDFSGTLEEIPGSFVEVLDDEKYIYLPDAISTYTVTLHGYGSGTTTIEVGMMDSDSNVTTTQTFTGFPTTDRTAGSFTVSHAVASTISVDTDGNGSIDVLATSTPLNSTSDIPSNSLPQGHNTFYQSHHSGSARPNVTSQVDTAVTRLYLELLLKLLQLKLLLLERLAAVQRTIKA